MAKQNQNHILTSNKMDFLQQAVANPWAHKPLIIFLVQEQV
uniref:Uncharacterized protein n=1 Tax=Rhizophora mucronata TaxID=61149 RepID=A0A2P2MUJ7_RHIMU